MIGQYPGRGCPDLAEGVHALVYGETQRARIPGREQEVEVERGVQLVRSHIAR